jgi:photosystem II CP47 chlorophyll apoprotein
LKGRVLAVIGLAPFSYGVISSHHILAGFLGLAIGFWHISSRPSPRFYKLLKMGNLEEVLSSSIAAVFLFWCAILISGPTGAILISVSHHSINY